MSRSELEFGFGSTVRATISGKHVSGEVVAVGQDNRDLEDDQYILALGADADFDDYLSSEEIVRETQITEVLSK